MQFYHRTLANGLDVVVELNPSVHSLAAGFFVRTGSRDETAEVAGVSHFLEHMAFKGNERFSGDDMNRILDELGASSNASTDQEVTNYYAAVLPEYLDQTMELLAAMMQPSLRQEDFDTEKKVILEEIGMYEDQPGFTAYDHVMATHFHGHPLSQSILGTNESIEALTSEQMRQYHADQYKAGNMTLAIAGNTDIDSLMEIVERHCGCIPAGSTERSAPAFQPQSRLQMVHRENSVQQHVMQMGTAPEGDHELRFAAELLSVVVGDDSGSRLFWEMTDPGFVDCADLGYGEFDGAGTWITYLSCEPEDVEKNLQRMQAVFDEVNTGGITEDELEQARNKVASRVVLRGERPMGRLSSLGNNWVYRGEYRSVADDLKIVRSVTLDDINALREQYPLTMNTTVGVGPRDALQLQ